MTTVLHFKIYTNTRCNCLLEPSVGFKQLLVQLEHHNINRCDKFAVQLSYKSFFVRLIICLCHSFFLICLSVSQCDSMGQ